MKDVLAGLPGVAIVFFPMYFFRSFARIRIFNEIHWCNFKMFNLVLKLRRANRYNALTKNVKLVILLLCRGRTFTISALYFDIRLRYIRAYFEGVI